MATIDGQWDCEVESPMGQQKMLLTLVSKPDGSFAGTSSGPLGAVEVSEGRLIGDEASFKMALTLPMPMTIEGTARIDGDRLTGTVDTGSFGRYPLRGTRRG